VKAYGQSQRAIVCCRGIVCQAAGQRVRLRTGRSCRSSRADDSRGLLAGVGIFPSETRSNPDRNREDLETRQGAARENTRFYVNFVDGGTRSRTEYMMDESQEQLGTSRPQPWDAILPPRESCCPRVKVTTVTCEKCRISFTTKLRASSASIR
jgi:hypothetical protein